MATIEIILCQSPTSPIQVMATVWKHIRSDGTKSVQTNKLCLVILDKSLEDRASVDSMEEACAEVPLAKFQLTHLGPVSRRDRLFHQLSRLTPYLTPVLVLALLVLGPLVLATICKVSTAQQYNITSWWQEIGGVGSLMVAEGSQERGERNYFSLKKAWNTHLIFETS